METGGSKLAPDGDLLRSVTFAGPMSHGQRKGSATFGHLGRVRTGKDVILCGTRLALRSFPRVDHGHARFVVVASITCHDGKAVLNGCRGDDEVRLRESVSRFPAFLNQQPSLQHNVFGDLQNPPVKHRPHLVRKPVVQLGAAVGFADKLNTKANFGKGYGADIELPKRTGGNEGHNARFRSRPSQLREDIRIE